jgi:hypothetical protein
MSSSQRATAALLAADPIALEAGRSVAALFDELERAGGAPVRPRTPARRPANYRAAGARTGGVRTVPLRSVQPAPMARPVPGASRAPEPAALPTPAPGRLQAFIRRAALWGAGPQGERLAWGSPARPVVRPAVPSRAVTPATPVAAHRPARLRSLVRRVALWGAGADGEYLAWGGPARPAPKPLADRPVVLREMPSTPTIQPAAPSPAAALLPRAPASSAGTRGMPPVPRGAVAVPGVRPSGRPERSRATGWPPQSPGSGVPTGLVRARGDPLSSPARGSPAPARRARSPGSSWSSFP